MRTVYVNTYPHIVIVCMENIEVGDEFLLDYGEGYNSVFLKPKISIPAIPNDIVRSELPGFASDSSSDDDNE